MTKISEELAELEAPTVKAVLNVVEKSVGKTPKKSFKKETELSESYIDDDGIWFEARPSQYSVLDEVLDPLGRPYGAFIGGIGSGKTATGAHFVLDKIETNPETLGLIAANTYTQLYQSTLPGLTKLFKKYGIEYVLNKEPKKFGYKSRFEDHKGVLSFRNGAQVVLRTLRNYEYIRGAEYGWFWLDETRDTKKEAWDVVLGRMREPNAKKICGIITTTPNGFDWLYETFHNDTTGLYKYVHCSTYENRKNLPAGYIEGLEKAYTQRYAEQELGGKFIDIVNGATYYAYGDHNNKSFAFDPALKTYMCWDFNYSEKPMSVVLCQEFEPGKYVFNKEFVRQFTNTPEMIEEISRFFKEVNFSGELIITGDSAGSNRQSAAVSSNYEQIEQAFGDYRSFEIVKRKTKSIVNRTEAMNAGLLNMQKEVRYYVDRDACPELHKDFQQVVWKGNGHELEGEKDKMRTHQSDAASYHAYNFHPLESHSKTLQ